MREIPSIDLHPESLPGSGPETALRACRDFLDDALRKGWKEVRVITGHGLHGDGTPRLRGRVEREVLAALHSQIASQHYEQGGAVIRLSLKPAHRPGRHELRNLDHERSRKDFVQKEERLMLALERLDAAEAFLDEGDLRRAKLKLNQLAREFAPKFAVSAQDEEALNASYSALKKQIDALS